MGAPVKVVPKSEKFWDNFDTIFRKDQPPAEERDQLVHPQRFGYVTLKMRLPVDLDNRKMVETAKGTLTMQIRNDFHPQYNIIEEEDRDLILSDIPLWLKELK